MPRCGARPSHENASPAPWHSNSRGLRRPGHRGARQWRSCLRRRIGERALHLLRRAPRPAQMRRHVREARGLVRAVAERLGETREHLRRGLNDCSPCSSAIPVVVPIRPRCAPRRLDSDRIELIAVSELHRDGIVTAHRWEQSWYARTPGSREMMQPRRIELEGMFDLLPQWAHPACAAFTGPYRVSHSVESRYVAVH